MISSSAIINYLQEKTAEAKVQKAITFQEARQKNAIIIKGNPKFVKGNPAADKFYNGIASLLRKNNYTVNFDQGLPKTMPPKADLWIGHSSGADRFQYAPKDQKKIGLGVIGGINHPMDRAMQSGDVPDVFHYILTKEMRDQILNSIKS